jgi:hypothetical protein
MKKIYTFALIGILMLALLSCQIGTDTQASSTDIPTTSTGATDGMGNVAITIAWPAQQTPSSSIIPTSREIPTGASTFYCVAFSLNGLINTKANISYPTTTLTLALTPQSYSILGLFANSAGVPLAVGRSSSDVAVQMGQSSTFTMTVTPLNSMYTCTSHTNDNLPLSSYLFGNYIVTDITYSNPDVFLHTPAITPYYKLQLEIGDGSGTSKSTVSTIVFFNGTPSTPFSFGGMIRTFTPLLYGFRTHYWGNVRSIFSVDFWGLPGAAGSWLSNPNPDVAFDNTLTGDVTGTVN